MMGMIGLTPPPAPGLGNQVMHSGLGIHPERTSIHLPTIMPHRDDGGAVNSAPGLQPTAANANPIVQGYMQRFAAMPPEQLQELIVRLGSSSPLASLAQHVLQQKRVMPPAPSYAQTAQPTPLSSQGSQQAAQPALPAPQQSQQSQGMQPVQQAARGGNASLSPQGKETVPILAAGGEFIVSPEFVTRWGDGDIKEGHRRLDKWVVEKRQEIIKTMRALKPPVKS